jgi:hypothetical protein
MGEDNMILPIPKYFITKIFLTSLPLLLKENIQENIGRSNLLYKSKTRHMGMPK